MEKEYDDDDDDDDNDYDIHLQGLSSLLGLPDP
jgi:hypothetical protein